LLKELNGESPDYSKVPGLTYRKNGSVIHNEMKYEWEMINFRDIPYHLIERNLDKYNRFNTSERIMPIFTSLGCPYQCAFCMAPVLYKNFKKKWVTYDVDEIIDHIEYLVGTLKATYLSVYDDDSFIDIGRMRSILEKIVERGIRVIIDFRGARINELDRIDDDYFRLMERAGVKHFQVGLESGSQKVLDIMNKKINYEQIVRVNRRLAQFDLVPIYNLMTGVPGEEIDDVKATIDLVLRLYEENNNCIIGFPAKFKPLPGTVLYNVSIERGLKPIRDLEDWANLDTAESDMFNPWYTREYDDFIKMFQVTSFFIDRKILREIPPTTLLNRALRTLASIYRPVALFRLRNKITAFNIEYRFYLSFRRFLSS
jgi:radical SAM superfamily enzyme YgiQ (UPF0313 family)